MKQSNYKKNNEYFIPNIRLKEENQAELNK